MIRVISIMLLASAAATPALAAPDDRQARQQAREDRQQARDSRPERAERKVERVERKVEHVEQVEGNVDRKAAPRARLVEAPGHAKAVDRAGARDLQAVRDARRSDRSTARDLRPDQSPQVVAPIDPQQRVDANRDRREQRLQDARDRIAARHDPRPPVVSPTPLPGTQPPAPSVQRPTPAVQWNGSWRDNHHYNWSNWRKRNRWLFNLGFYNDPFGWGYRPYSIGWRMWPSYYSSQYWLNDPWRYRLPYAPPGYRWVRYFDDAVLVDTWSGQVVDVIHSFFW